MRPKRKFKSQRIHDLCRVTHTTLESNYKTVARCYDHYNVKGYDDIINYLRGLTTKYISIGSFAR
jgi:hypothetical protein